MRLRPAQGLMASPDRGARTFPASALTYCWVGGLRRVEIVQTFVSLLPKASRKVAKFFINPLAAKSFRQTHVAASGLNALGTTKILFNQFDQRNL